MVAGGGIEVRNFFAIFRNFPQFFHDCFWPVHFPCLLVPFAFVQNNMLQCYPAPPPKRVNYGSISW